MKELKPFSSVLNPSMETVVKMVSMQVGYWMCPKLKFDQMHLATTRNLTNTLIRMVNAPLKILESKYSSCPFRFCKQHLFSACTSCTKVKVNVPKDQITYVRIYKILRISSNNTRKAVWDSSKARLHNWLKIGKTMDDNRCQNA